MEALTDEVDVQAELKRMRPGHPLINTQHVRELALEIARRERAAVGFDRVGDVFFVKVEAQLRTWMKKYIQALPTVGKTIK
ncbi:MAG: hypothetical protein ABFE02_04650 [Sulfuricella sp.]